MTTTVMDPIPPDTRSIGEMRFGSGSPNQEGVANAVRAWLRRCGVTVANQIEELGCTGASKHGLTLTEIYELRIGLGGGGVGLPCFVPPTRYCLAHSTIGGLQIGQASRHSEEIPKISRELSPRERGHVEMVEASRRVRGSNLDDRLMKTTDALAGRELPPGIERGDPLPPDDDSPELSQIITRNREISRGWVCPEHDAPVWACRYCVAQMIVEGPLAPTFFVSPGREKHALDLSTEGELVAATHVDEMIRQLDAKGEKMVSVYVHVATFSRKLARD